MRAISMNVVASGVDRPSLFTTGPTRPAKQTAVPPSSRRDLLFAAALLPVTLVATPLAANAEPIPPAPQLGDCFECLGEVNNTLNACSLEAQSCYSTLNDDELHFAPPWQYESSTPEAIEHLIAVATGGAYAPGLINTPFGVSRLDAAGYIAKGVLAVMSNGDMPAQPTRQYQTDYVPFDGVLVDRRTTENGSEYVRITLGLRGPDGEELTSVEDPVNVIDAEFLFLKDDNILNVRASSRVEPSSSGFQGGELALSFTNGLIVDRNVARRKMDTLRNALRWDLAPVVTDFDPKFNPDAPTWLEKVFKPFDDRSGFKPSGYAYPVEGGQ